MGDLTFNKILGSALAVALVIIGLATLSHSLFAPDTHGHGYEDEDKSLNERIAATYAYYVEVEDGGSAGAVEEEEVFDLGLALASADVSRGERSFQAKCQSCHQIQKDGANATGPLLWNTIGEPKASHDGFNYSGALADMGGEWTYQNMNDWLYAPSQYAPGTSMSFAGLRRDDERANVIAYMASMSENPPPFPAPMAQEASAEAVEDGAVDTAVSVEEMVEENPTEATGQIIVQDVVDGANDGADGGAPLEERVGEVEMMGADAAEAIAEQVEENTLETLDDGAQPDTQE